MNNFLKSICLYSMLEMNSLPIVESLRKNHALTQLEVSRCQLDSAAVKALCEIRPPQLTWLDISINDIGNEGAKSLCAWLQSPTNNLTYLNALSCGFSSEVGVHFSESLRRNCKLKTLYLDSNELGDIGIAAISSALMSNSSLTALSVKYNEFSAAGAIALASALRHNRGLVSLDLGDNPNMESDARQEEASSCLLRMVEGNARLLHLSFDTVGSSSLTLNMLLERNYKCRLAARDAALCFVACRQFRKAEFLLGTVPVPIIVTIARMVWHSRGDEEWLQALEDTSTVASFTDNPRQLRDTN